MTVCLPRFVLIRVVQTFISQISTGHFADVTPWTMDPTTDEKPPCTFTFKKSGKGRPTNARIRSNRGEEEDSKQERKGDDSNEDSDVTSSEDETKIERFHRKRKKNPLIQSTKTFSGAKRKLTGGDIGNSSDSDDDDDQSSVSVTYKSSRSGEREGPSDMGATATLEIDTETDKDARTIAEKSLKIQEELKDKDTLEDNVYRGLNNYKKLIVPKETAAGSTHSTEVAKGPVRAPSNIRSTVRWDYKPDLCKDYKETGFCGFGESCIFLHDRTDYKSGWQIELEYAQGKYDSDDREASKYEIPEEDMIPFKCLLCRQSFTNPVVTKCKHYFCERCALDHYKKSSRCAVCSAQTHGIFNPAKEIARRLKQRQVEREERREKVESDEDEEAHQDVQDDEEEDEPHHHEHGEDCHH